MAHGLILQLLHITIGNQSFCEDWGDKTFATELMPHKYKHTFLDVEISRNFVREDCPLRHEVSQVADVGDQGCEMAVDVQDRLREVEHAHGGAPVQDTCLPDGYHDT